MENWTLVEKLQGFFGASAPIIGGMFGIQLYEYLTVMVYGTHDFVTGWPLVSACILYAVVMAFAGFYLLLDLERKAAHNDPGNDDVRLVPVMILLVGTSIGLITLLHRAIFVMIPA